jgi:hypothetical protein
MEDYLQLERELDEEARRISEKYQESPVAIVLAGSLKANALRCVTGFSHVGEERQGHLRDLIEILQTSLQIETLRHFGELGERRGVIENNDLCSGGESEIVE